MCYHGGLAGGHSVTAHICKRYIMPAENFLIGGPTRKDSGIGMQWVDSRIEEEVKDEISVLSTVLNLVSQLPRARAYRLLRYCMAFVEADKPEATSTIDCLTQEMLSKIRGKVGPQNNAKSAGTDA